MSKDLGELLSARAEQAPVPELDVDRLVAAGEGRLRRRRVAAIAASVLSVVALAAAPSYFLLHDSGKLPAQDQPRPSEQPSENVDPAPRSARQLTYGEPDHQLIHYGDRRVDVTGDLETLDATDDGAVFTTFDRRVWFTDGSAARVIGRSVEGPPTEAVATGDVGSLAAWIEPADGQGTDLVVYDTSQQRAIVRRHLQPGSDGSVIGVVDQRVFWSGPDDPGGTPQVTVYDDSDGSFASATEADFVNSIEAARRVLVYGDMGSARVVDGIGLEFVTLGRRLLVRDDDGIARDVLRTASEQLVQLRPPPGVDGEATMFQWLDDERIALVVGRGSSRHQLIECQLPDGSCQIVPGPEKRGQPIVPDLSLLR